MGLLDGSPYFTMKLVRGRNLASLLAERTSPSDGLPRAVASFQRVCETVAYAHARGVIHRDLEPDNVMLGAYGEVLVVDWGMAKVLRTPSELAPASAPPAAAPAAPAGEPAETPSAVGSAAALESAVETVRSGDETARSVAGNVMGTPAYMPPEQAMGRIDALDERADVFALGAILAEILTGRPPWGGTTTMETLLRAARGQIDDGLAALDASGAPPELVALARDCLQTGAGLRPRNAGVVAERVAAYVTAVERRAQEARIEATMARRTQQVALAAGSVVAVALVAALVSWRDAAARRDEIQLAKSGLEVRNARLERAAYASRIQHAMVTLDTGISAAALRELESLAPGLRGAEWTWLRSRATPPDPAVLRPHDTPVADAGFSADGTRIAVASTAGDVAVLTWPGRERTALVRGAGQRVAWAGHAARLVAAREDGTIVLIDVATGARLAAAETGRAILAVAVSPDGTSVATGGADGGVRIASDTSLDPAVRDDAIRLAHARGQPPEPLTREAMALLAADPSAGAAERARSLAALAMRVSDPGGQAHAAARLALGAALLRRGEDDAAARLLDDAESLHRGVEVVAPTAHPAIPALRSIAARRRGRADAADALLAEARARAERSGAGPFTTWAMEWAAREE